MAKQGAQGVGTQAKRAKAPSTRGALAMREVRENAIVMRDGTLRAVLAVSSINFALKAEAEQEAVVMQYVQFLNALDFPIQIVIQSRQLDIAPYLEKLGAIEREQTNELLKAQMADYRAFVGELVAMGEIMTKSFYVVVPYSPFSDVRKGFFSRAKEALSPARLIELKEAKFRERLADLMQRTSHVQQSLSSIGLQSALLDTQALIELFYRLYNPVTSKNEPPVETGKLVLEV